MHSASTCLSNNMWLMLGSSTKTYSRVATIEKKVNAFSECIWQYGKSKMHLYLLACAYTYIDVNKAQSYLVCNCMGIGK